jgi:hypothetical protein
MDCVLHKHQTTCGTMVEIVLALRDMDVLVFHVKVQGLHSLQGQYRHLWRKRTRQGSFWLVQESHSKAYSLTKSSVTAWRLERHECVLRDWEKVLCREYVNCGVEETSDSGTKSSITVECSGSFIPHFSETHTKPCLVSVLSVLRLQSGRTSSSQ